MQREVSVRAQVGLTLMELVVALKEDQLSYMGRKGILFHRMICRYVVLLVLL